MLVEPIDDHHAVRAAKQPAPELALQIVTARVVRARVFRVPVRRLARWPALVAHRLDDSSAVFHDHHRRIVAGEDPQIIVSEVGTAKAGQFSQQPLDLLARNSLAFGCCFRGLGRHGTFGVCQALSLFEQLLLELRRLLAPERVDQILGLAFLIAARIGEGSFDALGNDDPRLGVVLASQEQVDEFGKARRSTEHAHVSPIVGQYPG